MKTNLFSLLTCLSLILSIALPERIGAQEPLYVVYDYMKVRPENYTEYIQLENVWKKIHTDRIRRGHLYAWAVDEILSPTGTAQEFNFITLNAYQGREMLAGHYEVEMMPENWQELMSEDEAEVVMRTEELRNIVKTDVFVITDQVMAEGWEGNADIVVTNFFKNGPNVTNEDHAKWEADLWKPIHEARVNDGAAQGWMLLDLVLPLSYAAETPYHSITNDYYTDMKQLIESSGTMTDYMAKFQSGEEKEAQLAEMWDNIKLLNAVVRRRLDGVMKNANGEVIVRSED